MNVSSKGEDLEIVVQAGKTVDVPFLAQSLKPIGTKKLTSMITFTVSDRNAKKVVKIEEDIEPSSLRKVIEHKVDIVPRFQDKIEILAADPYCIKGKLTVSTTLVSNFAHFLVSETRNFSGDPMSILDNVIIKSSVGQV